MTVQDPHQAPVQADFPEPQAGKIHVTKFYSFPYSNIKIPTIPRRMKTEENSIQFSWLWHPSHTSCGETQCYQTQIGAPTAMLPRSSPSALPAAAEAQVGRPELMLTHHLFMYLKRSQYAGMSLLGPGPGWVIGKMKQAGQGLMVLNCNFKVIWTLFLLGMGGKAKVSANQCMELNKEPRCPRKSVYGTQQRTKVPPPPPCSKACVRPAG